MSSMKDRIVEVMIARINNFNPSQPRDSRGRFGSGGGGGGGGGGSSAPIKNPTDEDVHKILQEGKGVRTVIHPDTKDYHAARGDVSRDEMFTKIGVDPSQFKSPLDNTFYANTLLEHSTIKSQMDISLGKATSRQDRIKKDKERRATIMSHAEMAEFKRKETERRKKNPFPFFKKGQ